jgi:hypothetical protein
MKLFFDFRNIRETVSHASAGSTSFDGTNDYVDAGISPRALVGSSSAFSVSAWINMDDDTNEYICGAMESGAERFYLRVVDASGIGYLRWGYGDSSSSDTDGVISLNEWHHVIWTYDTTNAKIYIDGELKNTTAVSGKTITNTDNLYIGVLNSNGTPANYLDGKISSFKIFNSALTLAQIQEMYLNPEQILPTGVASSNLKLWLPLQEGSGTTNYDGSGNNNHGTITGATWVKAETDIAQTALIRSNYTSSVFYPEGLTAGQDIQGTTLANTDENVLTLNGAEYVEVPDSDTLDFGDGSSDSPFSIEAWIKMDEATKFRIASKCGFDSNMGWAFTINGSDKLSLYLYDADTVKNINKIGDVAIVAGQWYHVVSTYDGSGSNSGILLYVDGSLHASTGGTAGSYTAMHDTTAGVDIGRLRYVVSTTDYSDGMIDDVRIYSDALSATEVLKNYNSGKSQH